jgi:hypothetical protein
VAYTPNILTNEKVKSLYSLAAYFAFATGAGLIVYGILAFTVLAPALIGLSTEKLAFMATHGGSVVSLYILLIFLVLAEVPVVLGLVALTIGYRFRCAIFGGVFELLNISVRVVGYMVLITVLSGMVGGFISAEGFAFWDNLGYMIEGGGFFLQTLAWGLFGWALKEGQGLDKAIGGLMLFYVVVMFVGGMLRIFGLVVIDFPDTLNTLSLAIVGPVMGILGIIILILLGFVFLRRAREVAA